jgi:hypothetical protein
MFYVYQYLYPETRVPFYIGKGQGDRSQYHLHAANTGVHENKLLENTIKKVQRGGCDPLIEVLQEFNDENEAYDEEERLIKLYGRKRYEGGPLCNLTLGGRGPLGYQHTEETKQKMRKPKSEEAKRRMSEAKRGKPQPGISASMTGGPGRHIKSWLLRDPQGIVHSVVSLKTFCREHGLNYNSLGSTLTSGAPISRGSSAGWQLMQASARTTSCL